MKVSNGNRMRRLMAAALVLIAAAAGVLVWRTNQEAGPAGAAAREARQIRETTMKAAPVRSANDLIPVGGLKGELKGGN